MKHRDPLAGISRQQAQMESWARYCGTALAVGVGNGHLHHDNSAMDWDRE